jgi:hypothetical protein
MASLSRSLLAVIDSLPKSTPLDLISTYKLNISKNADTFDKLKENDEGVGLIDSETRAYEATSVLFGNGAVFPRAASYSEEEQVNWSVKFALLLSSGVQFPSGMTIVYT